MWLELIGWVGTIVYLLNHAYISVKKDWNKTLYYVGNAFAAGSLVLSSLVINSWQAVINNGFWLIVSALLLLGFNLNRVPISKPIFYILLAAIWIWILLGFVVSVAIDYAYLGWSSVLCFGLAYLLFSADKMSISHYLGWNIYAALALLPQLWLDQNIPVFVLEIIWAVISLFGVIKRTDTSHLLD